MKSKTERYQELLQIFKQDIRTCIEGMVGASELLQLDCVESKAEQIELVDRIHTSGKSVLYAFNSMMDFVIIISEHFNLQAEILDVTELLRYVEQTLNDNYWMPHGKTVRFTIESNTNTSSFEAVRHLLLNMFLWLFGESTSHCSGNVKTIEYSIQIHSITKFVKINISNMTGGENSKLDEINPESVWMRFVLEIVKTHSGQLEIKKDDNNKTSVSITFPVQYLKQIKQFSITDVRIENYRELMTYFSHEFRIPLNAVLGFSELLCSENNASDEEWKQGIDALYKSIRKLLNAFDEMISAASIILGQYKLLPISVNFIDILQKVEQALNQGYCLASGKSYRLITDCSNNSSFIEADHHLLFWMFLWIFGENSVCCNDYDKTNEYFIHIVSQSGFVEISIANVTGKDNSIIHQRHPESAWKYLILEIVKAHSGQFAFKKDSNGKTIASITLPLH